MDSKAKDQLAAARAGFSPAKELRNLHSNGSASVAELREFLAGLQGKSPQEVIGIVSTSLLVQSMALAVAATIALLLLFTVGPYLVYGPPEEAEVAKKPAAVAANAATPGDAATSAAPNAPQGSSDTPDAERAAKVLGIDESKAADPKENPLDSPNLDKLLDGVE